jgi:hypothetical protein
MEERRDYENVLSHKILKGTQDQGQGKGVEQLNKQP